MDDIDLSEEELAAADLVKGIRDRAFAAGKKAGRLIGYEEGVQAARAQLAALSTTPLFARTAEDQEETASKPLDTEVEDLQLTVRAYNCLKREGLLTIRDLLTKSDQDLLDIRNFGMKNVEEVRDKLTEIGYALRTA